MASGFVTEAEIEERKKKRQEEWELVRKEADPVEAPEEVYDHRSLFERLEEQRIKKQNDWEEEHKFKNQFRGLDDEEVDFLDKIDDIRTEAERKRILEERMELEEYQRKQNLIKEQELQDRLRHEIKGPEIRRQTSRDGFKSKQQKLLMGVVKRKSSESTQWDEKKSKLDTSSTGSTLKPDTRPEINDASKASPLKGTEGSVKGENKPGTVGTEGTTAAAPNGLIGLLGQYGSDSESE